MIDMLIKEVKLEGNLSNDEKIKLLEIADKCPIHKTLLNEIVIKTRLVQ